METNGVTLLSEKKYKFFQQCSTIILPALGALYFTLAQLWGFPAADQVVGTIAALNVFMGAVTAVAKKVYNDTGAKYDGSMDIKIDPDTGKKMYSLNLMDDIQALDGKSEVVFKVNP